MSQSKHVRNQQQSDTVTQLTFPQCEGPSDEQYMSGVWFRRFTTGAFMW
jgi:hypothetical protein